MAYIVSGRVIRDGERDGVFVKREVEADTPIDAALLALQEIGPDAEWQPGLEIKAENQDTHYPYHISRLSCRCLGCHYISDTGLFCYWRDMSIELIPVCCMFTRAIDVGD